MSEHQSKPYTPNPKHVAGQAGCLPVTLTMSGSSKLVMKKPFRIVPYDARWKAWYAAERDRLLRIFANQIVSIHHIGSTAIPGAGAKAEIDLLLVMKDTSLLPKYHSCLERIGYRVRGQCLEQGGTLGRFYFSKDCNFVRTYKLHICQVGHPDIHATLGFVKYLSDHPEAVRAYTALKVGLSKKYNYGRSIEKYIQGKSDFVQDILRKAKKKYAASEQ